MTTPHTFDITYDKIENQLDDFVSDYDTLKGMNMRRCAKLGVIIHYIADYFTYPHNSTYEGNVKDHCIYERDLKHGLKEYLSTEEAMERKDKIVPLSSTKVCLNSFRTSMQNICAVNTAWQMISSTLWMCAPQ